nr:hypothetical protein [Tanacetum cinerariifolium]
ERERGREREKGRKRERAREPVGNKMLKSFPLPVMKIPLLEYFATASEEVFPLLIYNSWEQQVVSELVEKLLSKEE